MQNNHPSAAILAALFLPLVITACSREPDSAGATGSAASAPDATAAPAPGALVEWPVYGGSLSSQFYSPLDQIDARNVKDLKVAWTWYAGNFGPNPEMKSETTPLMIDGVLYATAGATRNVAAIDAASGETLWVWRPNEPDRFKRRRARWLGRGVSFWSDGAEDKRIFVVTPGFFLVVARREHRAAEARVRRERLRRSAARAARADGQRRGGSSSPSIVVGDVVIVGPARGIGARPNAKTQVKLDVRGFDVRTGTLLWTFHTIPQKGEFGYETWLKRLGGVHGQRGRLGTDLGGRGARLVYLPVEAPTSDHYGGDRPGNNLFGDSARRASTRRPASACGTTSSIHHDIWDYDNPTRRSC